MKCLSLTQPWATLVAIGAKEYETRSWYTPHRGLLAIHASKGFPGWAKDCCRSRLFERTLQEAGFAPPRWRQDRELTPLPLGAVLCVVRLIDCVRTERAVQLIPLESPERDFGDYSPERFAWQLDVQFQLERPVLVKGALGLWDIDDALLLDPRRFAAATPHREDVK